MEYEVVHEIKNLCRNNQMRDVFFEEIRCEDPAEYVRGKLKGTILELTVQESSQGLTIHAACDGMIHTFTFTEI